MTETSRISDQLRQIREEAGLSVRMLAARRVHRKRARRDVSAYAQACAHHTILQTLAAP